MTTTLQRGVVMYVITLSNDASIDVVIRFYIIFVAFSNELCNRDSPTDDNITTTLQMGGGKSCC